MEVFVLMGRIDFEGDVLLGVYASKEEARHACGIFTSDRDRGFDSYNVVCRAIGAPAEMQF
jgi:hypothetical protein